MVLMSILINSVQGIVTLMAITLLSVEHCSLLSGLGIIAFVPFFCTTMTNS